MLGPFALSKGTEGIFLGGPKLQAFMAYLALQNGQPVCREVLAELFWGDRPDKQARQSLREVLFRLKRVLAGAGADCLELSGEAVFLDARALTVDALNFGPAEALDYKPLLQGLSIPQSSFTAWLTEERARFDSLASTSLESLSAAQGDPKQALAAANKWIALDPLNEAAQRRAMEIEIGCGDRIAALQRYKDLTALLARELGIEPDAQTRALAETARTDTGQTHVPAPDAAAQSLPVVAVLPFENLSGDPEQDYFSSGITDELISALSLSQHFVVPSRNAASELLKQGLGPIAVAHELGASYKLQGGIRRAGNRLRVLAQLIDTEDHRQIWAHRFEGTPEDIFDFQDEIVDYVASALGKTILNSGLSKLSRRRTRSADTYDLYLKGLMAREGRESAPRQRIAYFEQCLAIDPNFIPAIIAAGISHMVLVGLGWSKDLSEDIERVRTYLTRAQALEPDHPGCQSLQAALHLLKGDLTAAKEVTARAAAQFPHDHFITMLYMTVHMLLGETRKAFSALDVFDRLRPAGIAQATFLDVKAVCHMLEGNLEKALAFGQRAVGEFPRFANVRRVVAGALALLGRHEEAEAEVTHILELEPDFSIAKLLRFNPYKMTPAVERYLDGLRQAGIPET